MCTTGKLFLTGFILLLVAHSSKAQIEIAHIFSKGHPATGFGAFLHAGSPVSQADEVGGELGLYYFAPGYHMLTVPLLVTYRHTLNGSGTGFYLEAVAGYSFGATDIEETDAYGNTLYDASGNVIYQKLSGPTAGASFGYIFPSHNLPLNIGLRYEHLFISGDPSQNILALRLSWSLIHGRSQ